MCYVVGVTPSGKVWIFLFFYFSQRGSSALFFAAIPPFSEVGNSRLHSTLFNYRYSRFCGISAEWKYATEWQQGWIVRSLFSSCQTNGKDRNIILCENKPNPILILPTITTHTRFLPSSPIVLSILMIMEERNIPSKSLNKSDTSQRLPLSSAFDLNARPPFCLQLRSFRAFL